jgi:hypothetical protein
VVVPEVGTPAPAFGSRTSADAPLEQITTDPEPEPAFYELSIADAVTSGRPSVIVFATPAFCTTAICGPTMEVVKSVATDFTEANFVHVEVYENIDDPQGELIEVDAVTEWGLPDRALGVRRRRRRHRRRQIRRNRWKPTSWNERSSRSRADRSS